MQPDMRKRRRIRTEEGHTTPYEPALYAPDQKRAKRIAAEIMANPEHWAVWKQLLADFGYRLDRKTKGRFVSNNKRLGHLDFYVLIETHLRPHGRWRRDVDLAAKKNPKRCRSLAHITRLMFFDAGRPKQFNDIVLWVEVEPEAAHG